MSFACEMSRKTKNCNLDHLSISLQSSSTMPNCAFRRTTTSGETFDDEEVRKMVGPACLGLKFKDSIEYIRNHEVFEKLYVARDLGNLEGGRDD